jgi:hypothetical protein
MTVINKFILPRENMKEERFIKHDDDFVPIFKKCIIGKWKRKEIFTENNFSKTTKEFFQKRFGGN